MPTSDIDGESRHREVQARLEDAHEVGAALLAAAVEAWVARSAPGDRQPEFKDIRPHGATQPLFSPRPPDAQSDAGWQPRMPITGAGRGARYGSERWRLLRLPPG